MGLLYRAAEEPRNEQGRQGHLAPFASRRAAAPAHAQHPERARPLVSGRKAAGGRPRRAALAPRSERRRCPPDHGAERWGRRRRLLSRRPLHRVQQRGLSAVRRRRRLQQGAQGAEGKERSPGAHRRPSLRAPLDGMEGRQAHARVRDAGGRRPRTGRHAARLGLAQRARRRRRRFPLHSGRGADREQQAGAARSLEHQRRPLAHRPRGRSAAQSHPGQPRRRRAAAAFARRPLPRLDLAVARRVRIRSMEAEDPGSEDGPDHIRRHRHRRCRELCLAPRQQGAGRVRVAEGALLALLGLAGREVPPLQRNARGRERLRSRPRRYGHRRRRRADPASRSRRHPAGRAASEALTVQRRTRT